MEWKSKNGKIFDNEFQIKLNKLFDDLFIIYPDMNIKYLKRDHESLSKRVRKIRQEAGYLDNFEFFNDFGFTYFQMLAREEAQKEIEIHNWISLSGITFNENEEKVLNELLSETLSIYPNMEIVRFGDCKKLKDKVKFFMAMKGYENYSDFFGDFGFKYQDLRFNNKSNERSIDDVIFDIKEKHPEPFDKTSDIKEYQYFRSYCLENKLNTKDFLVEKGLLVGKANNLSSENIEEIIEIIRKEHPEPFVKMTDIKQYALLHKYFSSNKLNLKDYLIKNGILNSEEDRLKKIDDELEQKIQNLISEIKQGLAHKYESMSEVPNIGIIKNYCKKNNIIVKDYLIENNILALDDEKYNIYNDINYELKNSLSKEFLIALSNIKINYYLYDRAVGYINNIYDVEYNYDKVKCKCIGSKGNIYNLSLELNRNVRITFSCDCPYFIENNKPCKHLNGLVLKIKNEYAREIDELNKIINENKQKQKIHELKSYLNFAENNKLNIHELFEFVKVEGGYAISNINVNKALKMQYLIFPKEYNNEKVVGILYMRDAYFYNDKKKNTVIYIPSCIKTFKSCSIFDNAERVFYDGTIYDWVESEVENENHSPFYLTKEIFLKDSENNWYLFEGPKLVIDNKCHIKKNTLHRFREIKNVYINSNDIEIDDYALSDVDSFDINFDTNYCIKNEIFKPAYSCYQSFESQGNNMFYSDYGVNQNLHKIFTSEHNLRFENLSVFPSFLHRVDYKVLFSINYLLFPNNYNENEITQLKSFIKESKVLLYALLYNDISLYDYDKPHNNSIKEITKEYSIYYKMMQLYIKICDLDSVSIEKLKTIVKNNGCCKFALSYFKTMEDN